MSGDVYIGLVCGNKERHGERTVFVFAKRITASNNSFSRQLVKAVYCSRIWKEHRQSGLCSDKFGNTANGIIELRFKLFCLFTFVLVKQNLVISVRERHIIKNRIVLRLL